MPSTREDLLRPSLSRPADVATAPYSSQAAFLTAFFGGPAAAVAMFSINSWRLGRAGRDAAAIALALAAYIGCMVFAQSPDLGLAVKTELLRWLGPGIWTVMLRLIGLAIFLLALLVHRREQRSAELFGLVRPNPWIVGIGLIAFGWACDVGLARWLA